MKQLSKAGALAFSLVCIALYWALQLVVSFLGIFFLMLAEVARAEDPYAMAQEITNNVAVWLTERTPVIANPAMLATALLTLLLVFLYLRARRPPATERLWLYTPGSRFYLSLAMLGLAVNVFLSFAISCIPFPEAWVQDYQSQVSDMVQTGSPALVVLTSCLLVPLVEELLFRGLIFRRLMVSFSPLVALLLQTVLFAGFHLQPLQIVYVLPCSLLLGLVFMWRRSLIATIVVHMAFNAAALLLSNLLPDITTGVFFLLVVGCAAITTGVMTHLYRTREREAE